MEAEAHRELMTAAVAHEQVAHLAALAGDLEASRSAFRAAADSYRASWESASPTSFGRLVGMQKAAILAGDGLEEAGYVEAALAGGEARSPTAAYARAIAALVLGEDERAAEWAVLMRGGSPAFERTATAIAAVAAGDAAAYRAAVEAIVGDFAGREAHLTGVPIADTAMMLEALAESRGLGTGVAGPLMPKLTGS
ncbi:MAG: hypothetical protein ACR2KV_00090 [Solirubrobacteraceae bacterium]